MAERYLVEGTWGRTIVVFEWVGTFAEATALGADLYRLDGADRVQILSDQRRWILQPHVLAHN